MNEKGFIKGGNNTLLKMRTWEVPNPKAKVLLAHGIFEHSGRYKYEAKFLNAKGISVYSYDHRGHGRSDGERGYVNSFDELIQDWRTFVAFYKVKNRGPFFIFGHSMGALIVISDLINGGKVYDGFQGLVSTGAALKINKDLSPFLQKISGVLSKISPRLQTIALDNSRLSHDPEVEIEHNNDPLNYKGKAKARMGAELLKQMKFIQGNLDRCSFPFLALHGEADEHAEIEGSEALLAKAQSKDKSFKSYPDMYHEITKEIGKDEVLTDLANWILERS